MLAFAGCGDDDATAEDADGSSVSTTNGPVVAHSAEGDGGNDALVVGSLTMSSGCLLVGEFPAIWPHGTTWDAESQTVQLSDGQVVAVGDAVSGGGGYPHLYDLPARYADPLAACPTNKHDEVAMFNAGARITVTQWCPLSRPPGRG